MRPHYSVHVIAAGCEREDCVPEFLCSATDRSSDRFAHGFVEPYRLVIQQRFCISVEFPQLLARRLLALSTMVNLTKIFQLFFARLGGSAPPRIVRQPVSVSVDHQV